jgi:geranylgeranyl diphosphate synthase type I
VTGDLAPYLTAIEDELWRVMYSPAEAVAPLYNMMGYHLGWFDHDFRPVQAYSGKRLRPLLCLLACEATGSSWEQALPAAAALELVHNFSLIHDDIEDDSPTRRGRATLWTVWGLAHGINAGDSMLVLARLALARLADRGLEPGVMVRAAGVLDATCLQLCHGQYMDIAGEGQLDVSEEWYMQMIGCKTAALIAASPQLGALIGASDHGHEHYRQFGWHLGLAFQMVDDILGIWGKPEVTGKPGASDILARKMTLPVIFALQAGKDGQRLADMYRQQPLTDQDLSAAIHILNNVGARAYVEAHAAKHAGHALAALHMAGASGSAAEKLRTLTETLTARQR